MSLPEHELIDLIKQGSIPTFEKVFHAHYEQLCRFASGFLSNSSECEEVVQDLFSQLWEKKNQIDINTSLKSYLFRSVRNRCLNQLKHQKVKEKYMQETIYTSSGSFQREEEPSELENEVQRALGKLPKRCREIFEMSRFGGLKYREIADALGLSPKTIEVQMGKALKILRKELKEHLP